MIAIFIGLAWTAGIFMLGVLVAEAIHAREMRRYNEWLIGRRAAWRLRKAMHG